MSRLFLARSGAFLILASAVGTAGCSSRPAKTNGAALFQKSAPLDGMDYVLATGEAPIDGAACPAQIVASPSAKSLIGTAANCARAANWKGCERVAAELARRDLESPWAPYFMSLAAGAAGDGPRALWMAELAQKKAARAVPLFQYQHGRTLAALGQLDAAFSEIDAASRSEPRLVDGQIYVGEVWMRDGDPKKAEDCFRRALAVEPRNLRAIRDLASSRSSQGDEAEAKLLLASIAVPVPGGPARRPTSATGGSK